MEGENLVSWLGRVGSDEFHQWELQYNFLEVGDAALSGIPGKGQHVKCAWDGDPSTWVDYIRKVRLTYERTRHRKRKYLGPELAAQLTGRARVVTQEIGHRRLVANDGARFLIEFLEKRLGRVPVPDVGTKAEELFEKSPRKYNGIMVP